MEKRDLPADKKEKDVTPKDFVLRKATYYDLPFLFKVSTEAMMPVTEALNPGKESDMKEKLAEYRKKFDPEKIEVIQYRGKDVGRLRVERKDDIYVGGIQILPEFQNKGIGTAIFTELIEESRQSGKPIRLEVHDVNENAMAFYKKLGFEEGKKVKDQTVMTFKPKK